VVYGAALEKRSPVIPERGFESHPLRGEVLEWSNRRAWRARVAQATVGSNPTLSAMNQHSNIHFHYGHIYNSILLTCIPSFILNLLLC
jgi:hypothetical protein